MHQEFLAHHAHHSVFVLLHGALLRWFLYSDQRFPGFLLVLGGGITSFTVGFHMLLVACSSPTVATAVFDYVKSSPLLPQFKESWYLGQEQQPLRWFININCFINSFVAAAVAAYFAKLEVKSSPRVANLLMCLLMCLSLATVLMLVCLYCLPSSALNIKDIQFSALLLLVLSILCIFSATKSCAVKLIFYCWGPLFIVVVQASHWAVHFYSIASNIGHWSRVVSDVLFCAHMFVIRAAVVHALATSQRSSPPHAVPPLVLPKKTRT